MGLRNYGFMGLWVYERVYERDYEITKEITRLRNTRLTKLRDYESIFIIVFFLSLISQFLPYK